MRPEQRPENGGVPRGSRFILVGEDDIDDEEFIREIFNSVDNSFSLVFISNGKQILTYLQEQAEHHLPCLILLDFNMPELNGAEVLQHLRAGEKYNDIPKIIWSTSASDVYKKICLEAGADDYIIKPSNVSDLTGIVRQMLSYVK